MRVEDACRPGLFTVDIDDSLEVAAHRMDQAQLGALAVVDGQRLVGIVTERGLVRAIARAADPADVPVAAYASSAPQTATVDQDARAIVQRMLVLGVRHLPVTNSDGQLIGMVSMRDLLAVEAGRSEGRAPVDVVRRRDLQRLALGRQGPCVSVFLPTHRAGREVEQAPIRLKNLLRQATEALQADGVRAPEIDRLLAPLRRLLDDRLFWQYQSDGLVLFSRPGWWRSFRVPLDLPELAVVDDRFHVTPLLPLLAGDGHFFVLALSQNQIRLLEGTRDRMEEVDLPGVPRGIRDALQGEEVQKQLQLYVADRGGAGAGGIYHGHGHPSEAQAERILRYFRMVDRGLREVLAGEHAPMVLAAVEHLSPIYRQANTYPQLIDEVLPGSPEGLSPHKLHASAWPIVEPLFLRAQREAAVRYSRLAGTGRTSQDPEDIVRAAENGRVETLFVSQHPAGPSAAAGDVSVSDEDSRLRDVLELATVTALSKGGTVYVVPAGEVPGGDSAAAVFRYPAQAHQAVPPAATGVLG